MYFWNIHKLKKDLLKKPLSESESFKYLFATSVVYSLGVILLGMMPLLEKLGRIPLLENNIWEVYSAIIIGLITVIGVYYVYKCNKGANGNNFLQKYFSIGWVAGIRWVVLIMLPIMIILVSVGGYDQEYLNITRFLADEIFLNLGYISYFWLLGKHIKEVAK